MHVKTIACSEKFSKFKFEKIWKKKVRYKTDTIGLEVIKLSQKIISIWAETIDKLFFGDFKTPRPLPRLPPKNKTGADSLHGL